MFIFNVYFFLFNHNTNKKKYLLIIVLKLKKYTYVLIMAFTSIINVCFLYTINVLLMHLNFFSVIFNQNMK